MFKLNSPVVVSAFNVFEESEEPSECLAELEVGGKAIEFTLKQLFEEGFKEVIIIAKRREYELLRETISRKVKLILIEDELSGLVKVIDELRGNSFILIDSTYIFEKKVLRKIAKLETKDEFFLIPVDRRVEAKSGLRVLIEDGRVTGMGAELKKYNALTIGIILCSRNVKELIAGGGAKLMDLLLKSIKLNKCRSVDFTDSLWLKVRCISEGGKYRDCFWEIVRRSLMKRGDGLVSTYINRPISTRISINLYRAGLRINPNAITALSLALCIVSSILLSLKHLLVGGILVQVASIVDGIDGELARLMNEESRLGGIVDSVIDRYGDSAIMIGLALSLKEVNPGVIVLLVLSCINMVIVSYLASILQGRGLSVDEVRRKSLATRDVRLLVIASSSILAVQEAALVYLAVFPTLFTLKSIHLAWKCLD